MCTWYVRSVSSSLANMLFLVSLPTCSRDVRSVSPSGKLHFPAGTDVTIRTNHVVVQGIFSSDEAVSPTTLGDGAPTKVRIVLTEESSGAVDLEFEPHSDNWGACGGMAGMTSCTESLGRKAFAVLGGLVDVKAVDDACPAWVSVLSFRCVLRDVGCF